MAIKFTGRHFPSEIIQQSVRYYISYKLSYRESEEVLGERGINVDHSTLNRWVIKYAPLFEHQTHKIRSQSLLRGEWTRRTLTSKNSGNITIEPLISAAMLSIFYSANTVMRKRIAPSLPRQSTIMV